MPVSLRILLEIEKRLSYHEPVSAQGGIVIFSFSETCEVAVERKRICLWLSSVLPMLLFVTGCGKGGPATVPVKGTLTIGGQPANGVGITLTPSDPKLLPASGNVENGAFTVFTGNQGTPGAMPGKYKVVLSVSSGGAGAAEAAKAKYAQGQTEGAKTSAPKEAKAPFPDKYKSAATSDKEVEVSSGSNDLKIDIPAE
jgi:hypothetical protein